jgi:hypothetical protein
MLSKLTKNGFATKCKYTVLEYSIILEGHNGISDDMAENCQHSWS